jgi:hypothetical protein
MSHRVSIGIFNEENGSTVTGNSSSKNASEDLSTADAFSLLPKYLDNALQQQKREIFNLLDLNPLMHFWKTNCQ